MDWLTSNCASLKLLQPQPLPGAWNADGSGLLPCQKSRVPAAMDRCATQLDEVYGSNVWSAMAYVSAYRQMFGSCAEFGFPGIICARQPGRFLPLQPLTRSKRSISPPCMPIS